MSTSLSNKVKELLNDFPFWQNMAGSQFVQGIALFIEKFSESFVVRCERALAESRFSTATKRSSILAGAQDKGYVPRKVTPSIGKAMLTNIAGFPIGVPIGTKLNSTNGTPYLVLAPVNLDVSQSVEAEIAQIEIQSFEYQISEAIPYLNILLTPEVSAIAHKVVVYVKDDDNSNFFEWDKSYMFRSANAQSRVYTETYTPLEELGIRFGNGVDGFIPPAGSIVKLEVWCTQGVTSLMQAEQLTFDNETLNNQVTALTSTSIVGGQPAEDTESVRVSAQYSTQYDNELVWNDDYIHFIRENIGQFSFLNVWGEEEQEKQDGISKLENVNTVFVSAASGQLSNLELSNLIIPRLQALNIFNTKYIFVDSNKVNIPVTVEAKVPATVNAADARNALIAKLEEKFGIDRKPNPDGTETKLLQKNVWVEIDELDLFDDFKLTVNTLDTSPLLEEYRYIDTSISTITVTYGKIY